MSRPTSIKDQTIIDAARAVFLERGFGATTAEVAERAMVSEGTLFKRFRTKAELFQAAMHPQFAELGWLADLEARVGQAEDFAGNDGERDRAEKVGGDDGQRKEEIGRHEGS